MKNFISFPRNRVIILLVVALLVGAAVTISRQFNSHPLKATGNPIIINLGFQSITSNGTVPSQGYLELTNNDCTNSAITHQAPVNDGFVSCELASPNSITNMSFYDTTTQSTYDIPLVDVESDDVGGTATANALTLLPNQSISVEVTIDERPNPIATTLTDLNAVPPASTKIASLSDAMVQTIQ